MILTCPPLDTPLSHEAPLQPNILTLCAPDEVKLLARAIGAFGAESGGYSCWWEAHEWFRRTRQQFTPVLASSLLSVYSPNAWMCTVCSVALLSKNLILVPRTKVLYSVIKPANWVPTVYISLKMVGGCLSWFNDKQLWYDIHFTQSFLLYKLWCDIFSLRKVIILLDYYLGFEAYLFFCIPLVDSETVPTLQFTQIRAFVLQNYYFFLK